MEDKIETILNLLKHNKIDRSDAQRFLKKLKSQKKIEPTSVFDSSRNTKVYTGQEDLAIIGMSGKFPGADNIHEFWQNIRAGNESVTTIPDDRWKWEDIQDHSYSRWGGFIKGVERFDANFFNYSPIEAESMDPQHRLLLEESWKCIESAGYNPMSLANTRCGVYVGVMNHDYFDGLLHKSDNDTSAWELMGNSFSILASRISYFLNLKGPAIAIDTACSSSLVATDLAAKALYNREIDMALVGGVTLYLHPRLYKLMSKARMLSPTGACKTFDNKADGIVVGEGVGAIALKRLKDAEEDRDNILSIIKGTGINQDGRTNGITAPSGLSQVSLLNDVYYRANVKPSQISYIEAHGTGTKLGDPVEFNALTKVFAKENYIKKSCGIGSVKSNIGHTSAASGLVSLIKCTMALNEKIIPPSLHFSIPNEHIDFENSPFYVPVTSVPWKSVGEQPRIAGISSFGFSGTNSHLILQEQDQTKNVLKDEKLPSYIFCFSGKTERALKNNVRSFRDYFVTSDLQQRFIDINYTLLCGRVHFNYRVAFIVGNPSELQRALSDYLDGRFTEKFVISQQQTREKANKGKKANQLLQILSVYGSQKKINVAKYSALLKKIAYFYVEGEDILWGKLFNKYKCNRVMLPSYNFDNQAYWIEGEQMSSNKLQTESLSYFIDENQSTYFEQKYTKILHRSHTCVKEHLLAKCPTIAGTFLAGLAIEAYSSASAIEVWRVKLESIQYLQPVQITEEYIRITIILFPENSGRSNFEILMNGDSTKKIAIGSLMTVTPPTKKPRVMVDEVKSHSVKKVSSVQLYDFFEHIGVTYGESFRAVKIIYCGKDYYLAELHGSSFKRGGVAPSLDPVLLDAAMHAIAGLYLPEVNNFLAPISVQGVHVYQPFEEKVYAHGKIINRSSSDDVDSISYSLIIMNYEGVVLAKVDKIQLAEMPQINKETTRALHYFSQEWQEADLLTLPNKNDYKATIWSNTLMHVEKSVVNKIDVQFKNAKSLKPTNLEEQLLEMESNVILYLNDIEVEKFGSVIHFLTLFFKKLITLYTGKSFNVVLGYQLTGTVIDAEYIATYGFLKSLYHEHPAIRSTLIRLDQDTDRKINPLQIFLEEGKASKFNFHVRYSQTRRYEKYVKKGLTTAQHTLTFEEEGVYLIVGGMGKLGQLFAQDIIQKGIKSLYLVGRKALSKKDKHFIESLHKVNPESSINYWICDLIKKEDIISLRNEIISRHGRIDGILHCGGVLKDELLLNKTNENLEAVIAPKLQGTLYLDEVFAREDLSFFILFSSIASIIGNMGQTDYAYANAYLDEFCTYRNRLLHKNERRGKTISINWPLWEDGGMTTSEVYFETVRRKFGMEILRKKEGLQAFYAIIGSLVTQVAVLSGNEGKLFSTFTKKQYAEEAEEDKRTVAPTSKSSIDILADLKKAMAKTLKMSSENISKKKPLEEYGIDSISMMEILYQLEEKYGKLPQTLFFECKTLNDLVNYIGDKVKGQTAPDPVMDRDQVNIPSKSIIDGTVLSGKILKTKKRKEEIEDIAIIGVAGRYPKAENIEAFWENLVDGFDCVEEIPIDRWDYRQFYGNREEPGKSYGKWGGFIPHANSFDALFFNLSPKEAASMDPQERVFLETCWHTLESAGYTRQRLEKELSNDVGVFVGAMNHDFTYHNIPALFDGETNGLGSTLAAIANRVSYCLNLKGPSMVVDTMCSSSLTSLHLACESLRRRESKMAIAGGVNLILHPAKYTILAKAHFLSSEGKCRSFGEGGDGYVPGEGVGAVLLKPLHQAIEDKDHIWGVIKSIAVNHNGKSNGFTVPSPKAQAEVIEKALRKGRVNPKKIGYIETHGTGTNLGDPIEIKGLEIALQSLMSEEEQQKFKCALGAVKSNIGHLEGAAGIAGLTKILLQFRSNKIVPSLHSKRFNRKIDFDTNFFEVVQDIREQPEEQLEEYYAGLSSFGAGGNNVHMILQKYPERIEVSSDKRMYFISLSSKTLDNLKGAINNLYNFLKERENMDDVLESTEYTLCCGREQMTERIVFLVHNVEDLLEKLDSARSNIRGDGKDIFSNHLKKEVSDLDGFISSLGLDIGLKETLIKLYRGGQLQKLAKLWCKGLHFPWGSMFKQKRKIIPLPGYNFERVEYPLPPLHISSKLEETNNQKNRKEFERIRVDAKGWCVIKVTLSAAAEAFRDHVFEGQSILSAACQIDYICRAMAEFTKTYGKIESISFRRKITSEDLAHLYLIIDERLEGKKLELSIYKEDSLHTCTAASWRSESGENLNNKMLSDNDYTDLLDKAEIYANFEKIGIQYGSYYRCLQQITVLKNGKLRAEICQENTKEKRKLPALIDAGFQTLIGLRGKGTKGNIVFYPYELESVTYDEKLITTTYIQVNDISIQEENILRCEIVFYDKHKKETGRISGVKGVKPGIQSFKAKRQDQYQVEVEHPQEQKIHSIQQYLRDLLSGYLNVPKVRLKLDTHLDTFGISSVMALELIAKLEEKFSNIPKTLFFEFQTVRELAAFFFENYSNKVVRGEIELKTLQKKDSLPVINAIKTFEKQLTQNKAVKTEKEKDDAIAIVGIDGRFPHADNLSEFWLNLVQEKDCITRVPTERKGFSEKNKRNFYGGFLKDVESFDALFFNIAPSEAEIMDPQERLFLETAWKAIEDANYTRKALSEEKVGVYVGAMYSEYQLYGPEVSSYAEPVALTGTQASIANRVSSTFNLHGPSMTLDTMCSSALTAIHLACQSIQKGECTMALAGGVNLLLHPNKYVLLTQGNFLSPEGKCKSFGKDGKGYVPGEGVGCVVLKSYKKAIQDNDYIYGVLDSTAINHGGRTSGYTVPSPKAQHEVIEQALSKAAISPQQIGYVEAHGTGTSLGDPIEIEALTKAYREHSDKIHYCSIGSVKSNIGHCESAAGMAGLFKILLQFKYQYYVPSIHSAILNPHINFDFSPFFVQRSGESFDNREKNTFGNNGYAALSSFGAGGSNAHFIISAHQNIPSSIEQQQQDSAIVLSAQSPEFLKVQATSLLNWLNSKSKTRMKNSISYIPPRFLEEVTEQVALTFHTSQDDLVPNQSLQSYGMDVALSFELKDRIEEKFDIVVFSNFFTREFSIVDLSLKLIKTHPVLIKKYEGKEIITKIHGEPKETFNYSLVDIAYSLQIGREFKNQRLAIICRDIGMLKKELNNYCKGIASQRIQHGSAKKDSLLIEALQEDSNLVKVWGQQNNLEKLCAVWVKGVEIPWKMLYTEGVLPKRVPLPTITFEKRQYWVKGWQNGLKTSVGDKGMKSVSTSILLQENVSTLNNQRFRSTFTGEEFFLRDHIIGGVSVLPGSVYLEMVHQAVTHSLESTNFKLNNIVWLQPLEVNGQSRTVEVELIVDNDRLSFQVYSTLKGEQKMFHCQGKVLEAKEKKHYLEQESSLRKLKSEGKQVDIKEIYEGFEKLNFHYGPSFRLLRKVQMLPGAVLGVISNNYRKADGEYTLHPSVIDACFQICGVFADRKSSVNEAYLPFSIKEIILYDDLPDNLYIYSMPSKKGNSSTTMVFDIFLLDENNLLIGSIQEFTLRQLSLEKNSVKSGGGMVKKNQIIYPSFSWNSVDLKQQETHDYNEKIWVYTDVEFSKENLLQKWHYIQFKKTPNISLEIPETLLNGFKEVFQEVKKLLSNHGAKRKKLLFFLKEKPEQYRIFSGLLKTASAENPLLQTKIVYITDHKKYSTSGLTSLLEKEISENRYSDTVRYRSGKREVQKLKLVSNTLKKSDPVLPTFRDGGVYWILGGMGGIGKILARYIGEQTHCTLVLSGRSSLTSEKKEELKKMNSKGFSFEYISCDLIDKSSVEKAYRTLKSKHSHLNGIIHSAGVTKDAYILKKELTDLDVVMPSKVAGTIYLDQITREEKLDFFCLFSSLASINGNFGQSDYSSANAFLDEFASYRQQLTKLGQRSGRSISINWPLWKEGGMRVGAEVEDWMVKKANLMPLTNEEGWEIFKQAMASKVTQVVPVKVTGEKAYDFLKIELGETQKLSSVAPLESTMVSSVDKLSRQSIKDIVKEVLVGTLKIYEEDITEDIKFADIGVDSIHMISILEKLEEKFGVPFDPNSIVQYPTLEELTNYICDLDEVSIHQLSVNENGKERSEQFHSELKSGFVSKKEETKQYNKFSYRTRNSKQNNKIAVISCAGRFPKSPDLESFWDNLAKGKELISEVPTNRWSLEGFYDAENNGLYNHSYSKHGGFMDDIEYFDPTFFNISEADAIVMDPQHRIMLELTQKMFDRAGYHASDVRNSRTSVYLGAKEGTYLFNNKDKIMADQQQHMLVNSLANMMAARISNFYDLKGASQTIDTACSSSLIAINDACRALRLGEVDMAIAGGIFLMQDPFAHISFSKAKVLSPDSHSYVFDKRARGFVLGEGAGLVLLKRYEDAIDDGDQIMGVIRGVSVNNDGHTMGVTVPNQEGQKRVILEALKASQIDPRTISYYEVHGTGTLLGDPIEIKAATEAYRQFTKDVGYCAVGSVKSNIGHSITAAGIAGFIKILLGLQKKKIPPTLNCEYPHPRFRFEKSPFYPNMSLQNWDKIMGVRRAALSSFGFGGTNAHLIIEEAPEEVLSRSVIRKPFPLTKFNKKAYWLGREISSPEKEEILIKDVLNKFITNDMNIEDAYKALK